MKIQVGRTAKIESTMPFKVRASCGHIVIRRMREATAGVPFSEDTILEAPMGRQCDECEAKAALFIGCMPTGLGYCDTRREESGDYKVVAFLPFSTLVLQIHDLGSDLLPAIKADAAIMAAKKGEEYQVSTSGQTVLLGGGK